MSALHVRVAVNRDTLLARWHDSVRRAAAELSRLTDAQARRRPAAGKWCVKEIIGHLIDCAANNHRRFVEAQLQDPLVFPGYAQDAWVNSQRYHDAEWPALVEHNLDALGWRPVPRTEPAKLGYLIEDYVLHLEHHLAQARGLMGQAPDGG